MPDQIDLSEGAWTAVGTTTDVAFSWDQPTLDDVAQVEALNRVLQGGKTVTVEFKISQVEESMLRLLFGLPHFRQSLARYARRHTTRTPAETRAVRTAHRARRAQLHRYTREARRG
jgi:hypothetical protein